MRCAPWRCSSTFATKRWGIALFPYSAALRINSSSSDTVRASGPFMRNGILSCRNLSQVRTAIRKVTEFLLRLRAPASGNGLAEAGGTHQGVVLNSARRSIATDPRDRMGSIVLAGRFSATEASRQHHAVCIRRSRVLQKSSTTETDRTAFGSPQMPLELPQFCRRGRAASAWTIDSIGCPPGIRTPIC